MGFKIVRANTLAERAGAYYVRTQAMAVKHHIPLEDEFDEHDNEDTKYIVILDDVLPVATARMYALDDDKVMIGRVVVLPEYRHRGLGTKVVEAAEAWASDLGCTKACVESRDNKTEFYQKLGYEITDNTMIEGKTFNCVAMEKTL